MGDENADGRCAADVEERYCAVCGLMSPLLGVEPEDSSNALRSVTKQKHKQPLAAARAFCLLAECGSAAAAFSRRCLL